MTAAPLIKRHHEGVGTRSSAVYSTCERYRYALTRTWNATGDRVAFVMLNPSTAGETRNDPTVERCERRARALGFGAFRVVNLFAWRDTDPAALRRAAKPDGPDNDAALRTALDWAQMVIAGWGTHGAHRGRAAQAIGLLATAPQKLHHLGLTKDGHPRHPLYISYSVAPQPWQAQDIERLTHGR